MWVPWLGLQGFLTMGMFYCLGTSWTHWRPPDILGTHLPYTLIYFCTLFITLLLLTVVSVSHIYCCQIAPSFKPWPNEVASRRKLKTWVNLRLCLARPCMDLRWLAMACALFGRDQICTQVDASFPPFGQSTQVYARWVTSMNLLLANEIREMPALECFFFCDLRVPVRKLASPFGHPTQVPTQVQLADTCDYLRVRLARALRCFYLSHIQGMFHLVQICQNFEAKI